MSAHDVMPPKKPKPKAEPFNVRAGRIPVLRHDKVMVGHVGPHATEANTPAFRTQKWRLVADLQRPDVLGR